MVRWYGEPVAVRPATGPEPGAAGEDTGPPVMFLWRQRVYVVREVLGHWRERRSWWAAVTGDEAGDPDGAPVLECEVWRLEAGAGGLGRGVFDLCHEPTEAAPESWRLLRSLD